MNQQSALFSVVIPTCNEGDMLWMTVDSILHQTDYPQFEIIIVDDGSTDSSCDRFKAGHDRVSVVTGANLGLPRARNLGAEHAKGEYVVFLDAHCTVAPDWLALLACALESPDVGVVGPSFSRLENPEPRVCGMTWMNYSLQATWFEPMPTDTPYEVPITPGGCQAFRLETFNKIGKYDTGLTKWGFEDSEICVRLWLLGYRVCVNSNVRIAHHFRNKRNFEVTDEGVTYNFLRLIHTHFSPVRIRRCIRTIQEDPSLEKTLDRLYQSDVFDRRHQMANSRVHDDEWFFEVFMPTLK